MRHDTTVPRKEVQMPYNPNIHKRHSIRLKDYNYAKAGMYFITLCIYNRECLLGKVEDDKMILNKIGETTKNELLKINDRFKYCNINIYQIMPNHIHFILELKEENKKAVGNIIRHFKGRVSSKEKIYWQRNYYEHIIRNEKEFYAICEYITNNPLNWKEDSNFIQY